MAEKKDSSLNMKRRDFTKLGLGALGLGVLGMAGCKTESTTYTEIVSQTKIDGSKHWAMAIDVEKLNKLGVLDDMVATCHEEHNVPHIEDTKREIKWIWGDTYEHLFEDMENEFNSETVKQLEFPALCNHCEQPPCCRACPTEATFQRADGIVTMDYHRCIACRFCIAACPYGARSLNYSDPRKYMDHINPNYPTRSKGVVEKCTFCYERIDKGEAPLCVEKSRGTVVFGDLNDENSDVRKALKGAFSIRRRVELGSGPSVYYIIKAGE